MPRCQSPKGELYLFLGIDRTAKFVVAQFVATDGTPPIILPSTNSSIRIGFDALFARLGIRPHVVAEVDNMAMMRLLAREDVGLSVLPLISVKNELEQGALIEADRLPGISETLYAITLDRRFPNPMRTQLMLPG